ncbi:NAD(P)H-dependent oxidoreductase [Maricaulis parjimensis]|uniref:NAD(P)H-dependent oxidoreductase n=1 Tax=Maricaulis parjimensis TaxID=144023 RepID=UPI0019395562|nr:NAD(P)H-dependent oxidoreductase [Maricaulis parjimensis]
MSQSICVINAHPDPGEGHFVSALADAYAQSAEAAGHAVSRIRVADIPLDLMHSAEEFATPPSEPVRNAQEKIQAADHVVLVFPLWLGMVPARLKAFIEQVGRNAFFLDTSGDSNKWPEQKMKGKSARLIVTMGMPGFAYGLIFGGHSLKGLAQGVFGMSGFKPVRRTVFGGVEAAGDKGRARMLARIKKWGSQAK